MIYVGYDDNRPTGLTGASGALRVWDRILTTLGVDPLQAPANENWADIEYASGLLADQSCAQVVQVPIPEDAVLQVKPGCGNLGSLRNRIRTSLRAWLQNK